MGRKLQFPESLNVSLAAGTIARLDAARREGESRLDLLRRAVDLELTRRGHGEVLDPLAPSPPPGPPNAPPKAKA